MRECDERVVEIEAMEKIHRIITPFDIETKRRVLDWVCDAHHIAVGPLRIKASYYKQAGKR